MARSDTPLTPLQSETLAVLGATGDRPRFAEDLSARLRTDLERALATVAANLAPDETVSVNKHLLTQVHGCQVRFLADDSPFEVTVATARGAVSHKAVELGLHWPHEPHPLDLVDEALARLTESDHWMSDFLQRASEADRAELRATSGDRVTKFFDCFPPLKNSWRPVTESALWVELAEGRVIMRGKVDLTLGVPRGLEAGRVIIDLKTGSPRPAHRDDLRFYALLETLKQGVPPRLVASFYLDSGRPHAEAVTEDLLFSAAARTADAVVALAELRAGTRAPVHRPSPACGWCPLLEGCQPGRDWLADNDLDVPAGD